MEKVRKENIFIGDVRIKMYIISFMKYTLIVTIVALVVLFIYFFSHPYYYKGINVALIGSEVSEVDNKMGIGVDKFVYIEGKELISYPYKKYEYGCGIGYSLTMYTENHKVIRILNELAFYCNDRKLLSKTQIINEHKHFYENVFIWPFINFKR
ncbi:hypothetical protein [Avibacterium avium]|uniref:hypothetical protein n=3 Tax=Pasteurellaceae TaxID=712 RepID=UPI003BF78646